MQLPDFNIIIGEIAKVGLEKSIIYKLLNVKILQINNGRRRYVKLYII